jgi:hypothetical protein
MKLTLTIFILSFLWLISGFSAVRAENTQLDSTEKSAGSIISGRLLRANGRSRPYTELELVPVGDKKKSPDMRLWAITNMSGYFAFKNVPDGNYTLSINFNEKPTDTSPFSTVYYPKTQIREEAKVFEVKNGIKFTRLQFRLLPRLRKTTVTGTVTWDDGAPVQNAFITVLDIDIDIFLDFRVKTDAEGRFSTKAYLGRKYGIVALLLDSATVDAYSEPIARGQSESFTLDAKTKPVKIIMKKLKLPKQKKEKDDGIIGRYIKQNIYLKNWSLEK